MEQPITNHKAHISITSLMVLLFNQCGQNTFGHIAQLLIVCSPFFFKSKTNFYLYELEVQLKDEGFFPKYTNTYKKKRRNPPTYRNCISFNCHSGVHPNPKKNGPKAIFRPFYLNPLY